jgi:hypothetical protein
MTGDQRKMAEDEGGMVGGQAAEPIRITLFIDYH